MKTLFRSGTYAPAPRPPACTTTSSAAATASGRNPAAMADEAVVATDVDVALGVGGMGLMLQWSLQAARGS